METRTDRVQAEVDSHPHTVAATRPESAELRGRQEFRPGEKLGRYVILQRLGSGAMGVVYAAYDPELDRRVAIKVVRARGESARARARLLREAQSMAKLSHPNVVVVHDVGPLGDGVFVAMEYVDGGTLSRWLADAERPWGEVVEVLRQAGRGLAAAHEAGIVHRDFKPDNVLIDHHGVVKVVDFGIAQWRTQALGSDGVEHGHDDSISSDLERPAQTQQDLTRTGTAVGTPAYMAPEQHLGAEVDARTDQFAFCVVLYEGLYGHRPFRGETMAVLAFEVCEGNLRPPTGVSIPAWVRAVYTRGLRSEAERRYPTMGELLRALDRRPPRRRGWMAAGAVVGVAAIAAAIAAARPKDAQICTGAQEAAAAVWSDTHAEALRRAFEGTGQPSATKVWSSVVRRLDEYTAQWVRAHREACVATRVRKESSERLLDLQITCLDGKLRRLSALVGVFAEANKGVVLRAVSAAGQLAPVAECRQLERLQAPTALPDDDEVRRSIQELELALAQIEANRIAGRYERGLEECLAIEPRVRDTEYPPLIATFLSSKGYLLDGLGRAEQAREAFEETVWTAVAAHDDARVAQTMIMMMWVTGYSLGDVEQGLRWARGAKSLIDRMDDAIDLEILYQWRMGALVFGASDVAGSLEHFEASLALLKRHAPDATLRIADLQSNIGSVHLTQGDLEQALALYDSSIGAWQDSVGPDHPEIASIYSNRALVLGEMGRTQEALQSAQRAVAIYDRMGITSHPDLAAALGALSGRQDEIGRVEEALASLRRASRIRGDIYGEDNPRAIVSRVEEAALLLHMGRLVEAGAVVDRELPALQSFGSGYAKLQLEAYYVVGAVREAQADLVGALWVYEARVDLARDVGASPELAAILVDTARVLAKLDRGPAAEVLLLEAIELSRDDNAQLAYAASDARFELAKLLSVNPAHRARARELATEAAEILESDAESAQEAQAIRAWLAGTVGPNPL